MGLNLKNEETCRLARELAAVTGRSMSAAVTEALRSALEGERRASPDDRAKRMHAIGKACASRLRQAGKDIADPAEMLYDAGGLPK